MGISIFRASKCSASDSGVGPFKDYDKRESFGNPNPRRFTILRVEEVRNSTIVEVQYPDAKNYEGRKIMVFLGVGLGLPKKEVLDPHFCDDGSHLSPFARFEPTVAGWVAAILFAEMMS